MIILYDCASAPSPRRARIFLAEKGIAHETVQVDLRNSEQLSSAYQKINPQCTVPALRTQEGGHADRQRGHRGLPGGALPAAAAVLGTSPSEKAQIASWNWRVEFDGLLAGAEALRNSAPSMANQALPGQMDYPQIPDLAQRGLVRVQQFFVMLNEHLADRDFIATDRFTVADITAVVAVDFARVMRIKPGDQHPHLQRWRAAMAQRPSVSL